MNKKFFCIILLLTGCGGYAQTYVSLAPSLTNTAGTLPDKANIAFELGQQWDVFSMGLDVGKSTLANQHGGDTSTYLELRPNLNIFQEGKFTNTFTAGIGYVVNAKESLLTEVTYGIEYSFSSQLHLNAFFGQYYYSGRTSASNVSFFGVSAAYYFQPNSSGSIIKRKDK
ncbi:MAG: hypothetical protein ABI472_21950 [Ginsengibacter sp.]